MLIRPPVARLTPQPLIAFIAVTAACAAVTFSWREAAWQAVGTLQPLTALLALELVLFLVLAHRFPVHIRHNAKICMGTVVLFLMAALLPPGVAAVAAGLGVLAGEMSIRSRTGAYLSDMATDAGRFTVVILLASLVAHINPGASVLRTAPLLGASLVLWLGDVVSCPLTFAPISREKPHRIVVAAIREAGPAEGVQLLVGLIGVLLAREEVWTLGLILVPAVLVHFSFKSAKEMHDGTREILESLADTVDLRDPCTGGHSRRVTDLSAKLLIELGKSGAEVDLIVWAARVHDIGKIAVPDDVLKKPGLLTPEEREIMEMHSEHGARFLMRYPDFARGVEIVRHHHEAWDGTGYPHRLKGTDIPFGARVIAVADSFDAMTSDRPYRKGMPVAKALGILREGRGKQWDAEIVDALLRHLTPMMEEPVLQIVQVPSAPAESELVAESA